MKQSPVIFSKFSLWACEKNLWGCEKKKLSSLGRATGFSVVKGASVRGFLIAGCMFAAAVAVTGCEPRGETKTVAQVFEISQAELAQALDKSISVEARDKISKIQQAVLVMAGGQNGTVNNDTVNNDAEVRRAAGEAAAALHPLINWAGYTSRAAGGELLQQLSNMEGSSSQGERVNVNPAAAKLLAARTLSWIASELNSLAFGLKEREGR